MTFLLQSEKHFGIDHANIGVANSKVLFSAYITSMLCTPITGYFFDLFGRRGPLLIALMISILFTFWMPNTAPNLYLLTFVRTIVGVCNTLLAGSPLIADYIKNESRGSAVAL